MRVYISRDAVIVLLACRHWLALPTPPDQTTEDRVRLLLAGSPDMPNMVLCNACRQYRRPARDEIDDDPMVIGMWELVHV
jgi:hypothetical protein